MPEEKTDRWALSFTIAGAGVLYSLATFVIGMLLWGVTNNFPNELISLNNMGPYWATVASLVPTIRLGLFVFDVINDRIRIVRVDKRPPPSPGDWR